MIREIKLQNWRAYDSAAIPLEPGTTFLVARNGVGKTSLLEAAQFALTGAHHRLNSPIRLGADHASVEIALQLPTVQVLRITRTLFADPKKDPVVEARLGDTVLNEDAWSSTVEDAYEATPEFIGRNAILLGGLSSNTELDFRKQLAHAYGLTDKRERAAALRATLSPLESEATELTRSLRKDEKQVAELEVELVEAEQLLDQANVELASKRDELNRATAHRDELDEARRIAVRIEQWDAQSSQLLGEARSFLPGLTADNLLAAVEDLARQREEVLAALHQRDARLRARIELVESSRHELAEAGAECPVCLRLLDEQVRNDAGAAHESALDELHRELSGIDLESAANDVAAARHLLRRCDALGERPVGPSLTETNTADPHEGFDSARRELEEASAEARSRADRLDAIKAALRQARELDRQRQLSIRAWREWALTAAAVTTLDKAVDEVLEVEVEPIAQALDDRWSKLFPDRPDLRFDLDGSPWRSIQEHRLDIEAFSAGERIVARLLMQLSTLAATTSVNFCMIDEPLEHLDPRTRRLVAGMLSSGRSAIGLRQLVITTYEEDLAQALADVDDSVHMEEVRAGRPETDRR